MLSIVHAQASLTVLVVALALLIVMPPDEAQAGPTPMTFVVDMFIDDDGTCVPGPCALREAIMAANAHSGPDTITFDPAVFPIGGAPNVLVSGLLGALPPIDATAGITIDGTGADVLVNGSFIIGDANGFYFYSAPGTPAIDVTVRNVGLYDFNLRGLYICGGGGTCLSNVTNVELTDVTISSTDLRGVWIQGGTVTGVSMDGLSTTSTSSGLYVQGDASVSDVTIRDTTVANADGAGIWVTGLSISDVLVTQNVITNSTATAIQLENEALGAASGVTITDNEIVAPEGNGISFRVQGVVNDLEVARNTIANADSWGMFVAFYNGTSNVIHDNTVSGSAADGIHIRSYVGSPATRVTISHNSTYNSGELGIDLHKPFEVNPGVTLNDLDDSDAGPNDLLNFPAITGDTAQTVTGTACASCTVELFYSDADPSGYGDGQQFLRDATADGSGNFTVSICGLGRLDLIAGDKVTATATDARGSTSEFSLNYTITVGSGACPTPTPSPSPTLSPTPTASPTATPLPQRRQGDVDCDGQVTPRDALILLLHAGGLPILSQTQPCAQPGTGVVRVGDVNCDGIVDGLDAVAILAFAGSLPPLEQTEPCTDVGST